MLKNTQHVVIEAILEKTIARNKRPAADYSEGIACLTSDRSAQFVFRSIFHQTSCCLVGSPRELYLGLYLVYQRNYFVFLQRKNAGKLKCDFVMFIFFIVSDWLNKACGQICFRLKIAYALHGT